MEQWVFDRCLEAEALMVPGVIVILISVVFLTWVITHKKTLALWQLISFYFFSIFIVCPVLLILGYLFGIFNCSAGAFWKAGKPAMDLYKEIKDSRMCPKTEKEISDINPMLYRVIKANADTKGYCDPKTNSYVWLVRPSMYTMIVFTSKETAVVKVPHMIIPVRWNVPAYSGDVNNIPR